MKRNIAIVVPTIRPDLMKDFMDAWSELFQEHQVHLVTVYDGEEPKVIHEEKIYFKHELFPLTNSILVQSFYTGVVNLGYAFVARHLPAVEYIMTFHDDEKPIGDPIQDHIDILNRRFPISWFSPSSEYMRGFPYGVREEAPVMFSHGVWRGIPDYDAPTQLLIKPHNIVFYKGSIPKGALFPLCGMNIAFRRAALPYVYFAPVAQYKGAERFDDIWGGIELKKDFDLMNWAVVTGFSEVQHNRASNVFSNLVKEAVGIGKNEQYWKGEYDEWYLDFINKRDLWRKYIAELL